MRGDPERCSDVSRAAGELIAGTATTAARWLLVEVPGSWPRDVADAGALPEAAHDAVASWLARTPRSRLHFIRRPGRAGRRPLAFVVHADEATTEVRRLELESHDALATVDLDSDGEAVDAQLVLVCGHGSRDRCCALRGTAVFGALSPGPGDEELWISSHQGGHRFAGNVLVLPGGIQLGRVDPDEAPALVARALAGRIELDRYRGRTCYERRVQVAEHALRAELALDGLSDLRLEADECATVRFRTADGTVHAVVVEEIDGPTVPASCGAAPEPQKTFSARIV
jgi:hypothetical protein